MARPRKAGEPIPAEESPAASSPISTTDARAYMAGATADAVVPDFTTATETAPLPRVQPREQFVLAWNIANWTIFGGRLVPSLRQIRLQPGVSRVSKGADGRINISEAKAHFEARGWRLIPHHKGPGGSYMRRTEVDPDGAGRTRRPHYHTAWERFYPGSDRVQSDERGYATWIAGLIAQGDIPACPVVTARGLEERARKKLEGLELRFAKGAETLKPQIDSLRAELAVIVSYIESAEAGLAPVGSEMVEVPDVG